ncbi:phosphoglycerate mutase family protein [Rhizobiaceae bacterium n13]|uniref:Phosphoglycerate mutase family protein n=1 Tax=Ferirhizobium litorale TaxID=2927786 RepID=A0AAE3QB18_9HYPH|nr:histidine phosphatase family protein [Fererhizobium litorale]MDI7861439.1 phosphoglycerate mutase family protein [Fererhizobium litorale]MDI7921586.1 phosphoglycerate mutase family protein [Fererhizobium litorale]
MLIYMIRHGQTDWNAEGRLQGQQNIDLNALGREQASRNGEDLLALVGDRIGDFAFVSSPLARTRETMERLRAAMGLDPTDYETDERLVEVSFGDWEGRTLQDLKKLTPDRLKARRASKWDFIPPGTAAESYEILSWRVGSWLRSVNQPTVCVAHGGVVRTLLHLVGDMDKDEAAWAAIPQDQILRLDTESRHYKWM